MPRTHGFTAAVNIQGCDNWQNQNHISYMYVFVIKYMYWLAGYKIVCPTHLHIKFGLIYVQKT
jgi:hypothetical protein